MMNNEAESYTKEIKTIKALLKEPGKSMLDLRANKIKRYLDYRLEQLAARRVVLLPEEQKYLLSEAGPSPLRFDPDFLKLLLGDQAIISDRHHSERQINEIISIKEEISAYLKTCFQHEELLQAIKEALESQIGPLDVVSEEPLVLKGSLDERSVMIFFYNDQWLLPDNDLIKDLKYAYQHDSYPVFIAKKIHGILFPYFKAIGAQGFNIYSALLTPADFARYNQLNGRLRIYQEVAYVKTSTNYQARVESVNILSDEGTPLAHFLQNIPMQVSLSDFLNSFQLSKHSFSGQVLTLSGPKVRQALSAADAKRALMLKRLTKNANNTTKNP